jgi:hypothetical protein
MRSIRAFVLFCTLAFAEQYHLSPRFRTVYILSMSNSLDQHLASRLTSNHVLWVVLEPAKADAVLTDSLDDTFWAWLTRTYAPAASTSSTTQTSSNRSDSPTTRRRGTIFLVDPRSRVVLWSIYEPARNESPSELDRAASRISNQLHAVIAQR